MNQGLASINAFLTKSVELKSVELKKVTEKDKEAVLSRLKGTVRLEDFRDCDLIVEAIVENLEEKKKIFATLDKICLEHTILAINTSRLSVLDMAMATKRPEKVLGMHSSTLCP